MTTRCKFVCSEVKQSHQTRSKQIETGGQWESEPYILYSAVMTPVYSDNPESENKKFWDYTPSGRLEFGMIKEGLFQVGKEYYLDITLAG